MDIKMPGDLQAPGIPLWIVFDAYVYFMIEGDLMMELLLLWLGAATDVTRYIFVSESFHLDEPGIYRMCLAADLLHD